MGEIPDPASLIPVKSIELPDRREIRVRAALARLQMAGTPFDIAGRGLAPYVTRGRAEALLELSVAPGRIELILARRTLGKPGRTDRARS